MSIFSRFLGKKKNQGPESQAKSAPLTKLCNVCDTANGAEANFCQNCRNAFKDKIRQYSGFISYRRDGGSQTATCIKVYIEKITNNCKHIFLDVDELQTGRFDEKLLRVIEEVDNFIIILSPGCLDHCNEKNDWLKREICHALYNNKNIIPVLIDGFTFPEEKFFKQLPEVMRTLPNYSGIIWNHTDTQSTICKILRYMATEKQSDRSKTKMGGSFDGTEELLPEDNDKQQGIQNPDTKEKEKAKTSERENSEEQKKKEIPEEELADITRKLPSDSKIENTQQGIQDTDTKEKVKGKTPERENSEELLKEIPKAEKEAKIQIIKKDPFKIPRAVKLPIIKRPQIPILPTVSQNKSGITIGDVSLSVIERNNGASSHANDPGTFETTQGYTNDFPAIGLALLNVKDIHKNPGTFETTQGSTNAFPGIGLAALRVKDAHKDSPQEICRVITNTPPLSPCIGDATVKLKEGI